MPQRTEGVATLNRPLSTDQMTPLHAAAMGGHLLPTQLLTMHGAAVDAEDGDGDTAEDIASSQGSPQIAEFFTAVAGWSGLQVAVGCRLHGEATAALRRGLIDPDGVGGAWEQMAVRATAKHPPASLWWPLPVPACSSSVAVAVQATSGWWPTRHWLHHCGVRTAVRAVLSVSERARSSPSITGGVGGGGGGGGRNGGLASGGRQGVVVVLHALPILPPELWLFVMRFFLRAWWLVTEPPTVRTTHTAGP
jgi:hypothetical protein